MTARAVNPLGSPPVSHAQSGARAYTRAHRHTQTHTRWKQTSPSRPFHQELAWALRLCGCAQTLQELLVIRAISPTPSHLGLGVDDRYVSSGPRKCPGGAAIDGGRGTGSKIKVVHCGADDDLIVCLWLRRQRKWVSVEQLTFFFVNEGKAVHYSMRRKKIKLLFIWQNAAVD